MTDQRGDYSRDLQVQRAQVGEDHQDGSSFAVKLNRPPELEHYFIDMEMSQINQLLQEREWLKNQEIELRSVLNSEKSLEKDIGGLPNLLKNIEMLQAEHASVQADHTTATSAVQKLQLSSRLLQAYIQNSSEGGGEGHNLTNIDSVLKMLVNYQTSLSSKILCSLKEINQLQREIDNPTSTRVKEKQAIRFAMHKLIKLKENKTEAHLNAKSDDRIKKEQARLEKISAKIVMQQNILKSLICGSGIHWAEDPSLMEFLISLGIPLDFDT